MIVWQHPYIHDGEQHHVLKDIVVHGRRFVLKKEALCGLSDPFADPEWWVSEDGTLLDPKDWVRAWCLVNGRSPPPSLIEEVAIDFGIHPPVCNRLHRKPPSSAFPLPAQVTC